MNDEEHQWQMDWRKLFAILMIIAGAVGSVLALFYIVLLEMMVNYARQSHWNSIWAFVILCTGLLTSILVGYLGVRMLRKSNT